jgi:hypothetical protein
VSVAERSVLPFPLLGLLLVFLADPGGSLAQQHSQGKPPSGLVAYAAGLFSSEPSVTEGALTLLLPIGARGVGLGRAMTAARGPEAVFWNPAGIAGLDGGRFNVYRGNHLAGESTAVSLLLTRQPLGAVAISYHLLDLGDLPLTDFEGNVTGSVSFRDHLAVFSFATQILPRIETGLNFKVFQSRITCRGDCPTGGETGTSYVVDAGVISRPLNNVPLKAALMIAHLGPDLQIINAQQADPLPTRVRAAVSYEVLRHITDVDDVELWVTGEMEDRWSDLGDPLLYLGAELFAGAEDLFFLRAGYGEVQSGSGAGASVGLGLRYERFDISVAKLLSGNSLTSESEPVHVSFGVSF